jgi:hypothetical protein
MSRRPSRCTEADLKRALRAAKAAGTDVAVEVLPNGTIRLVPRSDALSHAVPAPDVVI